MPDGKFGTYPKPRALSIYEIAEEVEHYRQAAINAIEAGKFAWFDTFNLCVHYSS